MKIQQLSLFLQNGPGRLLKATGILEKAGVNITALNIGETDEYGVLRLIVDDPEKAKAALAEEGMAVKVTDVNCVVAPDKPGTLNRQLKLLAEEDINVAYMYGYCNAGNAYLIMKTSDTDKAEICLARI